MLAEIRALLRDRKTWTRQPDGRFRTDPGDCSQTMAADWWLFGGSYLLCKGLQIDRGFPIHVERDVLHDRTLFLIRSIDPLGYTWILWGRDNGVGATSSNRLVGQLVGENWGEASTWHNMAQPIPPRKEFFFQVILPLFQIWEAKETP